MGPPDSHGVPRAPSYSGYCQDGRKLRIRGYHPLWPHFPMTFYSLPAHSTSQSYNPAGTGIPAVWASPRSLATTGGITFCFLFLRVLRCFSSPGSPPAMAGLQAFSLQGCPIQRSRDQRSLAPTPGFSQLATSFIAFWSLGIHRTPLRTFACILLLTHTKKEREKNMHIPWLSFNVYFLHKEANKIALVSIRLTQVFYFFIFLTHITYIYIIYIHHTARKMPFFCSNMSMNVFYVSMRKTSCGE